MADKELNMETETRVHRIIGLREYRGAYVWANSEVEKFQSFKCRDDDIWVCSFPRSGTTLTQQMVYLIVTLDFHKAETVELDERFPAADFVVENNQYYRGLKHLNSLPISAPRLIKSHMHHYLLPDGLRMGKGKIIYITRNPKSVIVSLYKLMQFLKEPVGSSLRDYVERFLTQKDVNCCPWGVHVRQFWEKRNDPNILFLQYEKVVEDRRGTIKRISEFLNKKLTEKDVEKIAECTSLESMKANRACNMLHYDEKYQTDRSQFGFINTGETDGWKRELPEDLIEKMDDLITRELKDTDIQYE